MPLPPNTHTYTHACTHTHTCMHTRTHARTHTHAHTHAHTHTRTNHSAVAPWYTVLPSSRCPTGTLRMTGGHRRREGPGQSCLRCQTCSEPPASTASCAASACSGRPAGQGCSSLGLGVWRGGGGGGEGERRLRGTIMRGFSSYIAVVPVPSFVCNRLVNWVTCDRDKGSKAIESFDSQ